MTDNTIQKCSNINESRKPLSTVLIMVCIYMFLVIERPWESIRYLEGVPIERFFAITMIIIAFMNNKFKIVNSPTNKWVYGLLALHFILAPFAFIPAEAINQGIEYSKIVTLYLLMLSIADDEETLKLLVKAFLFGIIFYALHSLLEYANGRHLYRMGIRRMIGVDKTFFDPNALGASLVISLPIAYVMARFENNVWLRRVFYGYVPLVVVCVVLTGSRSSSVGLVLLMLLWGANQQGKKKFIYLGIVLLSMAVIWNVMPEEKQTRIRTLWDKEAGPANAHESAEGRLHGFEVSWKMFMQNPLTGVGAGRENFVGYRLARGIDNSPTQAHVLYGEVLAEFGVAGALLLSGLVASIMSCCVRARRDLVACGESDSFLCALGGAIIVCLLLLLFFGFGGHNFYRPLWLWLAAWAGSLRRMVVH